MLACFDVETATTAGAPLHVVSLVDKRLSLTDWTLPLLIELLFSRDHHCFFSLARPIPRLLHARTQAAVDSSDDAGLAVLNNKPAGFGTGDQGRDHFLLSQLAGGNDLTQIEGGDIERGIGVERVAFPLQRGACPNVIAGG